MPTKKLELEKEHYFGIVIMVTFTLILVSSILMFNLVDTESGDYWYGFKEGGSLALLCIIAVSLVVLSTFLIFMLIESVKEEWEKKVKKLQDELDRQKSGL
jgi:hypothetical protein